MLMVAGMTASGPEVVCLASFGSETEGSGWFGERLPTRAQVMLSGIYGEEEIRISVAGAEPNTVNSPPRSNAILTYDKAAKVDSFAAKNINHRVPGTWLSRGMLSFVGLYSELNFGGTAACGGPRSSSLVLGKQ